MIANLKHHVKKESTKFLKNKNKKRAQKFTFQSKRDKCQAANGKSSTFL